MTSVTPENGHATAPQRVERAEPGLLPIYLNDHLAVATGMVELARRLLAARASSSIGGELSDLAAALAVDRRRYAGVLRQLGVRPSLLKAAGGWLGDKAGRLKLNGHLRTRSPMSTLVELEALAAGLAHSEAGWRTVLAAAGRDPRLGPGDAEQALADVQALAGRVAALGSRVGGDVFG